MKLPQSQWPNEEFIVDENLVNSEKKTTVKIVVNNINLIKEDPWYAKKSSYLQCLRGVAWLKRFINNCLAKERNLVRQTGFLRMEEIIDAETNMVKMIQSEVFPVNSNYICGLQVSQNERDLYYVTTKILNRTDTGRFRKPLLLPQVHPVVDKLVLWKNIKLLKYRELIWLVRCIYAVDIKFGPIHMCSVSSSTYRISGTHKLRGIYIGSTTVHCTKRKTFNLLYR